MEEREIFAALTIFPPIFVRLDGRAFHRLAERLHLKRPFDPAFHAGMAAVCRRLLADSGTNPLFAYTFSDEISLFYPDLPFSGRVEKIDSVTAAYAASALTLELDCRTPLSFDARIVPVTPDLAVGYLIWRQSEAWRNHINAHCRHALMEEGMSAREAAEALWGMPAEEMHELMFARGVNLAKTPAWQRRGSLIYRELIEKEGYNPVTGEHVTATRSRVAVLEETPLFSTPEGEALIRSLIAGL
ncbi:MAG: tRNA 5'-guanylyltransferase [Methanomicrobiaceae archaeon]|uniref:tRNA(His) guanylyltransferase n=1 Tax=hydrocarbon metagenome TaxID=938273 RepID=A0A0W8FL21_9ZZZZ|nr:tRNA 5'-guanylyltransferase [Methanomicrobiaceae archaeon]MDD5420057.1 tRNA(His) guanylyltransferase Thg1 family protein [Methanomicrobiaceae archaeon]